MLKLIVGLGNPGLQYQKTRHNAGFLFLDHLLTSASSNWSNDDKLQGLLANCLLGTSKVLLLKPQTFMNNSGESVGKVARYYKVRPEEILVAHDELDFEEGVVRIKKGGGHAGHNGLRDIIAHLGSKDFYRLRIGIGRPAAGSKMKVSDYVLSKPSVDGRLCLDEVFCLVEDHINEILSGEIESVMNRIHT